MLYRHKININDLNDSSALLYHFVNENSKVLDVGCATGELAEMLNLKKNCAVVGMEYDDEALAESRKKTTFEEVLKVDLNHFNAKDFSALEKRFDYIILGDVLEHLLNPSDVVEKLKLFLRPGGYFLFSIPNIAHASIKANLLLNSWDYTELGILDKTHVRFFTASSISQFLSDLNLEIKKLSTTQLYIDGYQKHKVAELPPEIFDFIVKDIHSHICQFVIMAQESKLTDARLKKNNSECMDIGSLPENLKAGLTYKIKRFLLLKLPKMIKYIQKWR